MKLELKDIKCENCIHYSEVCTLTGDATSPLEDCYDFVFDPSKQDIHDLKHRIAENQREIANIELENQALFKQLAEMGQSYLSSKQRNNGEPK